MRDFFLYQPFFRLLLPLLVGNMAYFLILLLNNNVAQLQEQFLGAELYFSCAVALLIQEVSRLVVLWWPKGKRITHSVWRLLAMTLVALFMSIVVTIFAVNAYYGYLLGYPPEPTEWLMFIGIFSFFALVQLSLMISHHFLATSNIRRLAEEEARKENLEADFNHFKHGINPDLLFESLEALIVCLHQDQAAADDLLDQLSIVYRYILGRRTRELVPVAEELDVLKALIDLFNYLPYCNLKLEVEPELKGRLIPGALLTLTERIVRNSIVFPEGAINLTLSASETHYVLQYNAAEKIVPPVGEDLLKSLQVRYKLYSELDFILMTSQEEKTIGLPIVYVEEFRNL